jgi:hypothetical protein
MLALKQDFMYNGGDYLNDDSFKVKDLINNKNTII